MMAPWGVMQGKGEWVEETPGLLPCPGQSRRGPEAWEESGELGSLRHRQMNDHIRGQGPLYLDTVK